MRNPELRPVLSFFEYLEATRSLGTDYRRSLESSTK